MPFSLFCLGKWSGVIEARLDESFTPDFSVIFFRLNEKIDCRRTGACDYMQGLSHIMPNQRLITANATCSDLVSSESIELLSSFMSTAHAYSL